MTRVEMGSGRSGMEGFGMGDGNRKTARREAEDGNGNVEFEEKGLGRSWRGEQGE
jgi:hypothetical protein